MADSFYADDTDECRDFGLASMMTDEELDQIRADVMDEGITDSDIALRDEMERSHQEAALDFMLGGLRGNITVEDVRHVVSRDATSLPKVKWRRQPDDEKW